MVDSCYYSNITTKAIVVCASVTQKETHLINLFNFHLVSVNKQLINFVNLKKNKKKDFNFLFHLGLWNTVENFV